MNIYDHAGFGSVGGLNNSQRGLIAARIETRANGLHSGAPTIAEVAAAFGIHRSTLVAAKRVLAHCSPEEIAAVENGEIAAATLFKLLGKRLSAKERKAHRTASISARGRNPERVEAQQFAAQLWGQLRVAIVNINGLPAPEDVAAAVRKFDRSSIVDAKLNPAIKWLQEFSNAWQK